MFSVVNVFHGHLKFCVVCIIGRMYVCCSECNVVSNECSEVMYFGCICFRYELGFLNYDDICMWVMNEQFELLEFVFDFVYVDLQYDKIWYVSLCCICSHVVVFGLSVRLSWFPMWMRWLL